MVEKSHTFVMWLLVLIWSVVGCCSGQLAGQWSVVGVFTVIGRWFLRSVVGYFLGKWSVVGEHPLCREVDPRWRMHRSL